ncbi:MAG: hypothetical protein HRF50_08450 [Phycisphaerae bacterium]|jgi:GNAT superfamily N-acetyltransferase
MKPLLVFPPAPGRWCAMEALLADVSDAQRADLQARFCAAMPGAQDAFGVIRDGGHFLCATCVRRSGPVAVLGPIVTRTTHRRQGLAERTLRATLTWFDMTGGERVYATIPAVFSPWLERAGFTTLHHVESTADALRTMRRERSAGRASERGAPSAPLIRSATPADYALLVELLQDHPGPDPRVPLAESAVAAEATVVDWLAQSRHGACHLLVAIQDGRAVGLAVIATDRLGPRTYAVVAPHLGGPAALRSAMVELARGRGYEFVDLPLESPHVRGAAPASGEIEAPGTAAGS